MDESDEDRIVGVLEKLVENIKKSWGGNHG